MARIEPTAAWRAKNAEATAATAAKLRAGMGLREDMGCEEFVALMCASLTPDAIENGEAGKWLDAMTPDELRRLDEYLLDEHSIKP